MRAIHVTAALLVFTVCLSSPAGADDTQEDMIGMEGWAFDPVEVTIRSGTTVTWLNDDTTTHDVAFVREYEDLPTVDKPQKIGQTETYSIRFDQPGTFKYVCTIHRDYDMKGTITVE